MFLPVLFNQAIATSLAFLLSFNSIFTWPLAAMPSMLFGTTNEATSIGLRAESSQRTIAEIERDEYLQAMIAVIAADGVLSADELIRLYELFSTYGTSPKNRVDIITDLSSDTKKYYQLKTLNNVYADQDIQFALAKDALLIEKESNNQETQRIAQDIISQLALNTAQVSVLSQFVNVESQVLQAMGAGDEWTPNASDLKELASQAIAVGLPIAALNFAGVVGLSAIGITSGLAAIGTASGLATAIPFLNPMTAGVGALVLGGVAVKKSADFIVNRNNSGKEIIDKLAESRKQAAALMISDLPSISCSCTHSDAQKTETLTRTMQYSIITAMGRSKNKSDLQFM